MSALVTIVVSVPVVAVPVSTADQTARHERAARTLGTT